MQGPGENSLDSRNGLARQTNILGQERNKDSFRHIGTQGLSSLLIIVERITNDVF